jgi:two-component system response regulator PilR (NtrC family)
MSAIMAHSFPGNVRELENLIERAVTLTTGDRVTVDTFPSLTGHAAIDVSAGDAPALPETGIDLDRVLEDFERSILIKMMERTKGNRTEAARLLGVSFRSLRYRLSKLGIAGTDAASDTEVPGT